MWYQLQIDQCNREEVDSISDFLEEKGAIAITLTDKYDAPVLEPLPGTTPLWPTITLTALYQDEEALYHAKQALSLSYPHLTIETSLLEDQHWERAWMDNFKPQQFGKRLWVCPSHHTPPAPNAVNLFLDPGLAFGTGTHPTTHLCLNWLEQANLKEKTLIDYGCGSGILALAAILLGAAKAYAVDIDPQALQATKNNAEANGIRPLSTLANESQLVIGYPQTINTPVDLIIANILLTPLIDLQTTFYSLLKPGGFLVVSGILNRQASNLISTYQKYFKYSDQYDLEDWSLLVFSRQMAL